MIRFIEDLGIIPNKNKPFENLPSLKQGQKMMEYERVYNFYNTNKIRDIEKRTYPSKNDRVKSIIETMDTIESTAQNNSKIALENNLSTHEKEFYRLLVDYSITHKMLENEMIQNKDSDHSQILKKLQKLYDSIISISSVIEKEIDQLQAVSDKKLANEFANKKYKLENYLKKIKKTKEPKKKKETKETEDIEDTEEPPTDNKSYDTITHFAYTIGFIILISLTIHQILYKINNFYLYVIFLTVVAIMAIYNNSYILSVYNNNK